MALFQVLGADVPSVVEDVATNVAAAGAVVLIVWFRDAALRRLMHAGRWVYSVVRRRRYVLIWIDDEWSHARKLARCLRSLDSSQLSYRALRRARSVMLYPLSPRRVKAVVLIDTDVSKLSDETRVRQRIETRLREYVEDGGGIVGTHDVIYRRVRAEELQTVFGCRLTSFKGAEDDRVQYRINREFASHPLREGLPDEFDLSDGEVCWGTWAPDVDIVYTDADKHPLVVAREVAEGRSVWLNSGDKAEWLCASIAKPEDEFVRLTFNALSWVDPLRNREDG